MKIFVSSVITGFEGFREAAKAAIESLGHDVVRAEDFVASPVSPQIACLSGIRQADAVVLILGSKYGAVQKSGKSATQEEFEEARGRKPLFVFVQSDVTQDAQQASFIADARAWSTGAYTGSFSSPETLRSAITIALHRWAVANAAGSADPKEMAARAADALPSDQRGIYSGEGPQAAISVVGAPRQSILRPAQLEDALFLEDLKKRALFGDPRIFSIRAATDEMVEGHAVVLTQRDASLRLDEEGGLLLKLPLQKTQSFPALIQEEVQEVLRKGLAFSSQLFDAIDTSERLSHIAIAATVINAQHATWRTRREHEKSPNSGTIGRMFDDSPIRVMLSPPARSRSSFRQETETIAQDLTVLLRRAFRR